MPPLKLRATTPAHIAAKLAEPQLVIVEAMAEAGLDLASVAATLSEVLAQTEDQPSRVAAARLFFDVTYGRAPLTANTKSLHLHAKSDKFFDEATFSQTPPPKV